MVLVDCILIICITNRGVNNNIIGSGFHFLFVPSVVYFVPFQAEPMNF